MPIGKRKRILLVFAAFAGVMLVRTIEAAVGAIPVTRAIVEAATMLSLAAVAVAALDAAREANRAVTVVLAGTLVVWAAGVLVPLWRIAHQASALYEGSLGGATREVTTPIAAQDGRYQVRASLKSRVEDPRRADLAYVLRVGVGEITHVLSGAGEQPEMLEIVLRRGQSVRLFVEVVTGAVSVVVRPTPLPWGFVRSLAGLAALLSAAVEILRRVRPKVGGLFAMAVSASAILVSLLDPEDHASGRAVLATAALAIVVGGLYGGTIDAIRRAWR